MPPRMLEPPPFVQSGLELYMRGFFELAGDRVQGGKLSWSTIQSWCDGMGLEGDDARDVHFLLSRMDAAYVEWASARGKKLSAERKMETDRANARGVRR